MHPRKELGQNFVIDPNTIRKVMRVAQLTHADNVLEIGAGAGSLTLGLAAVAGRVVAVEQDDRLVPVLDAVAGGLANVAIVHADAMSIELDSFGAEHMVANLPYNIAALLVLRVLQSAPRIERLTVMTQREVGERLASGPGTKTYGAPSVLLRLYADAQVAGTVSRRAFWPVPNVDSVIVHVRRASRRLDVDEDVFCRVVKAAFAQRRKTIRNALTPVAGSVRTAEEVLSAAGIDPALRGEALAFEEFARIAGLLT